MLFFATGNFLYNNYDNLEALLQPDPDVVQRLAKVYNMYSVYVCGLGMVQIGMLSG